MKVVEQIDLTYLAVLGSQGDNCVKFSATWREIFDLMFIKNINKKAYKNTDFLEKFSATNPSRQLYIVNPHAQNRSSSVLNSELVCNLSD